MINSYINDPHQRKLLKKWGAILEYGKKITNESTKVALAQVLENTYNFYKSKGMINEAAQNRAGIESGKVLGPSRITSKGSDGVMHGANAYPYSGLTDANGGYGDYYLPNVVMPMLRRIMPDLIANDLVGVQPLNGPVGYALAYRPIYGQNGMVGNGGLRPGETGPSGLTAEIGFNPPDTRWTGSSAATPQYADSNAADAWQTYAGNGGAQWNGEGQETLAAEYANLSRDYPTVSFGLVKSAVEAKTRKLAAHWSPELAEDMQAMHGIDVEKEMINTITYEVGAEIDRQIITEMVKAAITGGSITKWSPKDADGLDQMGRLATLLTQITVEAQQIAVRTRRGNANFVVTTPRICALLQQLSMNKYTSFKTTDTVPTTPDTGVGALSKIGLINDDSQLLVRDAFATTGTSDYILLGYKGKQPGDSGIIYMPYIPLQLAKVLQPGSFTPSVGARTRYGIMSSPWDASRYYAFINVTGLTEPYTWSQTERHFLTDVSPAPSNVFDNTNA
jgi:hypothetical protein